MDPWVKSDYFTNMNISDWNDEFARGTITRKIPNFMNFVMFVNFIFLFVYMDLVGLVDAHIPADVRDRLTSPWKKYDIMSAGKRGRIPATAECFQLATSALGQELLTSLKPTLLSLKGLGSTLLSL